MPATRGISLGVMSKSFAMAGLRIGWLATRDRDLLDRCARFKDYTTICSSAPSEVLALIGLRARDTVLARSRRIVAANLERSSTRSSRSGLIGSPGSARGQGRSASRGSRSRECPIDEWAAGLVEAEGVLLLPGSQFGYGGNHFRLGFGRTDLPGRSRPDRAPRRPDAALTGPPRTTPHSPAIRDHRVMPFVGTLPALHRCTAARSCRRRS